MKTTVKINLIFTVGPILNKNITNNKIAVQIKIITPTSLRPKIYCSTETTPSIKNSAINRNGRKFIIAEYEGFGSSTV